MQINSQNRSAQLSEDEFDKKENNPIWLANQNYYNKIKEKKKKGDPVDQEYERCQSNESTIENDPNNVDELAGYTQDENLNAMKQLVKYKIIQFCDSFSDSDDDTKNMTVAEKEENRQLLLR